MRNRRLTAGITLSQVLVIIGFLLVIVWASLPAWRDRPVYIRPLPMSRMKVVGLAFVMYAESNDKRYPLANSVDMAKGTQRWNHEVSVPAGWLRDGVHDQPHRVREDSLHWVNSVRPFLQNDSLLRLEEQYPVPMVQASGVDYAAPRNAEPIPVSMTFNGLLHSWSTEAVADFSMLTLLWAGHFRQNRLGFALTSPVLLCDLPVPNDPCLFRPDRPPQVGASNKKYGTGWWSFPDRSVATAWVIHKGMHFVGTDTSARFVKMPLPTWPIKWMANDRPWSSFEPGTSPADPFPVPHWMIDCVAPGKKKTPETVLYPGFFRPDSEFNYTESECDIGNG